jgi:hypothetical protein
MNKMNEFEESSEQDRVPSEAYMEVFALFEEVLGELASEYRSYNYEHGEFKVNKDELTTHQVKKIHQFRMKLQKININ